MSLFFALYLIFPLPINKMIRPAEVQKAITPVMGMALWAAINPTQADANEPNPICNAPINAEALPASFVNGAIDKAAEFGKQNP